MVADSAPSVGAGEGVGEASTAVGSTRNETLKAGWGRAGRDAADVRSVAQAAPARNQRRQEPPNQPAPAWKSGRCMVEQRRRPTAPTRRRRPAPDAPSRRYRLGLFDTRPFHTGAADGLARGAGPSNQARIAHGIKRGLARRRLLREAGPERSGARISIARHGIRRACIDATGIAEQNAAVGLSEVDQARPHLNHQAEGLPTVDRTE